MTFSPDAARAASLDRVAGIDGDGVFEVTVEIGGTSIVEPLTMMNTTPASGTATEPVLGAGGRWAPWPACGRGRLLEFASSEVSATSGSSPSVSDRPQATSWMWKRCT